MKGRWTVWLKNPKQEPLFRPLARDGDGAHIRLVHWTGNGADPETECRVIDVRVDNDGNVTVEHSTAEGVWGISPEHITRLEIPGWEEWGDEEEAVA